MRLYLLRHGKAIRKDEDQTRPLTARGERQVIQVGRLAAGRGMKVDRVLHSPKMRARQTAELFCREALPEAKLETVDWMLPGDEVDPWVERLQIEDQDLLLVGHNDFMERLAEQLLGRFLRFRTSTLGAFERNPDGEWDLVWLENPPAD